MIMKSKMVHHTVMTRTKERNLTCIGDRVEKGMVKNRRGTVQEKDFLTKGTRMRRLLRLRKPAMKISSML